MRKERYLVQYRMFSVNIRNKKIDKAIISFHV